MSSLTSFLTSVRGKEVLLPILKKKLAIGDKKVRSGERERSFYVKMDSRMSIACFTERIAEFNHGDKATKDYFHPSQIGQCPRKLWYAQLDAPDNGPISLDEQLRQHLTFEIGTYFHVLFQNLCQRAGVLDQREVPIQCDEHKIIGHMDGRLKNLPDVGKAVLEIKTIKSANFDKLVQPKQEHSWQANIYCALQGLDHICFAYFNKDTSAVKEFFVKANPAEYENIVLPRIAAHHRNIKERRAPNREGRSASSFPCSYCEFSKVCWYGHEDFMKTLKKKGGK